MMKTLFWTLLAAAVLAALAPRSRVEAPLPNTPAAAPVAAPIDLPAGNGLAEVTLTRAGDGHFYADAMVNGAPVHFMVDTGATTVALTKDDAQAAGVQFSNGDFTAVGQGAGGTIALKPVTLDRVALGPVEARGVDAVVADGALGISLLGQSWLRRVGTVTISGDRMVLR
jgi:aspartyl protease family protein